MNAGKAIDLGALRADVRAVLSAHGLDALGYVTTDVRLIEQAGKLRGVSISVFAYEPPSRRKEARK